jgi:hypothetical protein
VFSVERTHVFYLTVWFQRERFEALLAVNIMELVFFPWCWRRRSWKSRLVEEQWWSDLGGEMELALCSGLHSCGMKVGATTQVKFRVLPLRVETQGLALTGCAWQWPCWRHCFESGDYLQGENLRSFVGRWRCWCTVPFLETSLLESLYFRCCLWWWMYCCC